MCVCLNILFFFFISFWLNFTLYFYFYCCCCHQILSWKPNKCFFPHFLLKFLFVCLLAWDNMFACLDVGDKLGKVSLAFCWTLIAPPPVAAGDTNTNYRNKVGFFGTAALWRCSSGFGLLEESLCCFTLTRGSHVWITRFCVLNQLHSKKSVFHFLFPYNYKRHLKFCEQQDKRFSFRFYKS